MVVLTAVGVKVTDVGNARITGVSISRIAKVSRENDIRKWSAYVATA